MVSIEQFTQVRSEKLESVPLMGFLGEILADERQLFDRLKQSIDMLFSNRSVDQYLVILPGLRPLAAIEAVDSQTVPEGMTLFTIPEDNYVIFRFEEKFVGDFWNTVCTSENQAKYRIDLSKPRFERFTAMLQSIGITEWYIPAMS
ncbi:GyrI-like domain-containing protein [Paenibacillus spongiae]|uniref:GyrI-like domain-containing protein n=1 Tax=Paenibacillus spongiae TaxID=2909671 RepID=A0ABY5SGS8_9BACL|nr:GyrI-like domain-containing protein [Paenibacillus spongiae]UVI33189.1 GyrI-like domain-containing protein [Paenibacillus spongiae]